MEFISLRKWCTYQQCILTLEAMYSSVSLRKWCILPRKWCLTGMGASACHVGAETGEDRSWPLKKRWPLRAASKATICVAESSDAGTLAVTRCHDPALAVKSSTTALPTVEAGGACSLAVTSLHEAAPTTVMPTVEAGGACSLAVTRHQKDKQTTALPTVEAGGACSLAVTR